MSDIAYVQPTRKSNLSWVLDVFIHPRKAFQLITTRNNSIWIIPLIIISIFTLVNVIVVGRLKHQAALTGELILPPGYQYWTPEQQAQYTQASQSTQGPVFLYVLPGISSLVGVWFGWLILGGLLHLVTTLFGGRGNTIISMNVVAWASLPLALRKFVQILSVLITQRIINNPGLSGFGILGDSNSIVFFNLFLKLIDIYMIWQLLLMILGVKLSTGLTTLKSTISTVITFLIILLIQTGFAYLVTRLSELQITRPFFF